MISPSRHAGPHLAKCLGLYMALLGPSLSLAQLTFEGAVYHEATRNGYGIGTQDTGGALFMFVRNNTGAAQTFTNANVTINGVPAASQSNYDWSRVWPISVQPGEVATLTLKGNGGVFSPNQNVDITLSTDSNVSLSRSVFLSTPKLRVGNVVPSQDLTKSYVYLRNDDTTSYNINDLFLNDNVTGQSRFVGGSNVIPPNSIKIIEVDHGQPQELLTPYAVRVEATRTDNNQIVTTGAPVRVTEPILPTSSWQADLATNEGVMRDARLQYGHDIHGATSRFPSLMETRLEEYSIRGLHIDVLDFPNGDLNTVEYRDFSTGVQGGVPYQAPLFQLPGPVADRADDPAIYGWYVRDEPDLQQNSSTRNPQAMWRLNDTYWRNSPKPTFINLVKDNVLQRYGLISDHPAIDRYMQEAPLSDSVGNRNIDQVLQYADSLKNNTEPLRMWWVTQGVSDAWGGDQPTDWGIDVQFWSAIMGGAKGMVGFMLDNREATHPALHARQMEVVHELQTVRNLVLYGETIDNTTLSVGGNTVNQSATDITAAARSIISENAVILPVANLTGRYSGIFFGSPTFDVLNDVTVDVTIPDWIENPQVKRVTQDGFVDLSGGFSFTKSGQQVAINIASLVDTDVFVISEADVIAPEQVENLKLIDGNYLAWQEPFDNFGVHGYQILENDNVIGNAPTPIFELPVYNPGSEYQIRAYDASFNFGAPSITLGSVVSRWDGNNPSAGTPGDGSSWSNAANWTRDGVVDAGFANGTRVVFAAGSTVATINLQADRTATSLDFQASYTLSGFDLTVDTGEIAVHQSAVARITSDLITAASEWTKSGTGVLRYDNTLAKNMVVAEGTYAGTSTNQGGEVLDGATLKPGNPSGLMRFNQFLVLRDGATLEYSLRQGSAAQGGIDTGGILGFGNIIIEQEAILKLTLDGYQAKRGDSRRLLTGVGAGNLTSTFATFDLPFIGPGLGWELVQDTVNNLIDLRVISTADYNGDGTVDLADYVVWRDSLGQSGPSVAADGNGNGIVDAADYTFWKQRFGTSVGLSNIVVSGAASAASIPEPATGWLVAIGLVALLPSVRRAF